MEQFIKEFWALIAAAGATVAWAVRVESGMLANRREIQRMWERRAEDLLLAQRERDEDRAMLGEIRQDIKRLLAKSGV